NIAVPSHASKGTPPCLIVRLKFPKSRIGRAFSLWFGRRFWYLGKPRSALNGECRSIPRFNGETCRAFSISKTVPAARLGRGQPSRYGRLPRPVARLEGVRRPRRLLR